jgi:hypothetical protein
MLKQQTAAAEKCVCQLQEQQLLLRNQLADQATELVKLRSERAHLCSELAEARALLGEQQQGIVSALEIVGSREKPPDTAGGGVGYCLESDGAYRSALAKGSAAPAANWKIYNHSCGPTTAAATGEMERRSNPRSFCGTVASTAASVVERIAARERGQSGHRESGSCAFRRVGMCASEHSQ